MPLELFVTGTDTGVGKTATTAALLGAARASGRRTAGLKPVESGCHPSADGLRAADAEALAAAAGHAPSCAYRFADAIAPGAAAERAGQAIDFSVIADHLARARQEGPDLLCVEGAGGLLVPLGGGRCIADVARHLELPLLLVAKNALGTVNHTLLTLEAARARGLEVAAVVLSAVEPPRAEEENAAQIARYGEVPVLELGHGDGEERIAGAGVLVEELFHLLC